MVGQLQWEAVSVPGCPIAVDRSLCLPEQPCREEVGRATMVRACVVSEPKTLLVADRGCQLSVLFHS